MIAIHIPAPRAIRDECSEIRRGWSDLEIRRRAENAARRQSELFALLASGSGEDGPPQGTEVDAARAIHVAAKH